MAPGRDDFDFRAKWAVGIDEMMRCLNECQPNIIHFSGHGSGVIRASSQGDQGSLKPRQRDVDAGGTGIYLQEENRPQHVTGRALTQMIATTALSAPRVVVLNACFGDAVAEALLGAVDCVVSMNGAVGDDAARSFAAGFYRALGNHRSIGNAVAQAVATLAARQLPDEHLPICRTRGGVSADQIFLCCPDPRRT